MLGRLHHSHSRRGGSPLLSSSFIFPSSFFTPLVPVKAHLTFIYPRLSPLSETPGSTARRAHINVQRLRDHSRSGERSVRRQGHADLRWSRKYTRPSGIHSPVCSGNVNLMNDIAEGHAGFFSPLALETTWLAQTGVKKGDGAELELHKCQAWCCRTFLYQSQPPPLHVLITAGYR